jgi:TIMELESS-interacting protein
MALKATAADSAGSSSASRSQPRGAILTDGNPRPSTSRFATYPNARPRSISAMVVEGDRNGLAKKMKKKKKKKKKKERSTCPKLTLDLLLSNNDIGFVLLYFPKAFMPRGQPGHEVTSSANWIH